MELYLRPLDRWPREFTERRVRSPFKAAWADTTRLLFRELRNLGTGKAVLQMAIEEHDVSPKTGWLRADSEPEHPGVILAADTKHGALKWVCDQFTDWRSNVRGIALTLERLRLADLYGVTRRGEQYLGWKMLPGPITAAAPDGGLMTVDAAARFVASHADADAQEILKHAAAWQSAYREAAKRLHPDASGDPAKWLILHDAATLLNSLHNRK